MNEKGLHSSACLCATVDGGFAQLTSKLPFSSHLVHFSYFYKRQHLLVLYTFVHQSMQPKVLKCFQSILFVLLLTHGTDDDISFETLIQLTICQSIRTFYSGKLECH